MRGEKARILAVARWQPPPDRARRAGGSLAPSDRLHSLTPEQFEVACSDYFKGLGYRVELTPVTRDGGIDLLLRAPDGSVEVVQCKHQSSPVGEPTVRDLFGVLVHMDAKRAHLITSSTFTEGARRWAKGKPIILVDGPMVAAWVDRPANMTPSGVVPGSVVWFIRNRQRGTPLPWLLVRISDAKTAPIHLFANRLGFEAKGHVVRLNCTDHTSPSDVQAAIKKCHDGDILLCCHPETLSARVKHLLVSLSRDGQLSFMAGRGKSRHLESTGVPKIGICLVTNGNAGTILQPCVDRDVDGALFSDWWSRLRYVLTPSEATKYVELAGLAYTVEGTLWDIGVS